MTLAELRAADCDVDAAAYARLKRFVAGLLEENRCVNLISSASAAQVWPVHICDSLALLPLVQERSIRTLLDLGSGGGLPGVPLACVFPTIQVTLLDATRKKLAAVERVAAAVGLTNVRWAWGRAEVLAHEPAYREQFDAVTARAVAELPELVELAAGFVHPGGDAWFFKTLAAGATEVAAAQHAAGACAMEHVESRRYRVPHSRSERVIVVYRKCGALGPDLPRRPGRPRK